MTWMISAGTTIASLPPGFKSAIDARMNGTHAFVCFVKLHSSAAKICSDRSWNSGGKYW